MHIYRITNLVNGKMYIGMTNGNNKQYIGSGKLLKQAIAKYGIKNFNREILETCETDEELRAAEAKWIKQENAVASREYYNLCEGGRGGDTGNYDHGKMPAAVKASWDSYDNTEKHDRIENAKNKGFGTYNKSGFNNPRARKALVNNKEYQCLKDACKDYPEVPYSSLKTIAKSKSNYSRKWNIKAKYVC